MSEIKLEVGQVWEVPTAGTFKILEIFMVGTHKQVGYRKEYEHYIRYDQNGFDAFSSGKNLIINADGTPHIKPNIYIAGDIWTRQVSFDDKFIEYFIYKLPDGGQLWFQCTDGKCGPVADNFFECPQDYSLIFRGCRAIS